jgi:hypothetical protein
VTRTYPYRYYIALDGNGIDGLEGMAGVCSFLFDPEDNAYAFKIEYYDGVSGGHAVTINPSGGLGFLGNVSQQFLLFDPQKLEEQERITTLRYEVPETTIAGSTHAVWLSDREFLTAVGKNFYKFHVDRLDKGELLGPHDVKIPHAIKTSSSGRYLAYGSMDQPGLGPGGAAKEVGIWDTKTGLAQRIALPTTCWHLIGHPKRDVFYAISFNVMPQENGDYRDWGMAFMREYVFEIDAASCQISRVWSCSRETPAHINSDVTISDSELIFCNGASQSIVFIDLEGFAKFRMIDEKPDLRSSLQSLRQIGTQVYDSMARGGVFTSNRHLLTALRVSRFSMIDSVYGCQLSADQRLLFTANRGLNHISIYDYPENTLRLRVQMPDLQEYLPNLSKWADPRLGFHHSHLVSPE